MSNVLVSPSVLSANFANLESEVHGVVEAGADWVHVDVMDGHFVPNITIGVPVVKSLRKITKVPLDVHLMIENPEKYIEAFAAAGADYLTVHIETANDPTELLQNIRELGVRPGLTLRPSTDFEAIRPYLALVDLVLVMTVEPGFSGQGFMADQIEKIKKVSQELEQIDSSALIEVDGGVNKDTAPLCVQAGANVLVSGNFVFKNDYPWAIAQLKGENQ